MGARWAGWTATKQIPTTRMNGNDSTTRPDPTMDNFQESLHQDSPKRYRPKTSSLPTTLVRTLNLNSAENSDTNSQNNVTPIELCLQLFIDRIFISVTQLNGKVGSLLVCNVEESVIDNSTTYNIQTLLGAGVPRSNGQSIDVDTQVSLREVYVRAIAERILKHTRKIAGVGPNSVLGEDGCSPIPTLVVGLGLKSFGREEFGVIVEAVMELYLEGWKARHGERLSGMEGPD